MTRYAPSVDISHSYQTLSTVAVCPSLDICTAPSLGRIITELSRPAQRAHLTTGDGLVVGRPRKSWLRTVEADVQPMSLGLATAKRRALDRSAWRKLVVTATSSQTPPEKEVVDYCDVGVYKEGKG